MTTNLHFVNKKLEWKKINNYENYSVSNMGRVRNDRTRRVLKPGRDRHDYFFVGLHQDGTQKNFLVHRLVAVAFISNPLNLPDVNHKDLNKVNNKVNNLEWCTHLENMQHARRNGIKFGRFQKNNKFASHVGIKNGRAKLNDKQILEIRTLYITNNYIQQKLARKFNVSQNHISRIVNYKNWKHI